MLARGGRESNPPLGKKHRCDLGRGGWVTKTGRENCEEPGVGRWKSGRPTALFVVYFFLLLSTRENALAASGYPPLPAAVTFVARY